jgi:hypothetical protein
LLVGRLGLSLRDAKALDSETIEAVIKHGLEDVKEDWKRFRWLATILVNVSGKSVKRNIQDTDLLRFEDEKKENGFAEFYKSVIDGPRRNE